MLVSLAKLVLQRLTVQAVNVHPQGSVQELSLMDEDDQKFSLPEDTRMVNIAQLVSNGEDNFLSHVVPAVENVLK